MDRRKDKPPELSAEEKRKRRQLARIRQVQRMKKRLLIGGVSLSAAVVLIVLAGKAMRSRETFSENQGGILAEHEDDGISPHIRSRVDYAGDSGDTSGSRTLSERDDYIAQIRLLADQDDRYQKVLDRQNEYPENVLRLCALNEEALDFVVDYPDRKNDTPADTIGEVITGQIPLLIQWDRRWGYAPYGSETIVGVSGCGPTRIAMAASGLTGRDDITPAVVADYSANNGFLTASRDTSWDLMTYGAQEYGIIGTELGLDESAMINQLNAGRPIIASMGPGDFTTGGHLLVITGYDGTGFTINDPNSRKNSQKSWEFERLKGQIKNLWYYTLS